MTNFNHPQPKNKKKKEETNCNYKQEDRKKTTNRTEQI